MPTASTKKEQIDERILRILGLNPEEVEMDYITYHNALRESMVKGAKSGLPQEELALIANERRRIRNKKGRFQVKTKKVKINNNNLNSPIKEKRKMLPGATKKEGPSQTKGGALVKSDSSTTDIVNTQGKLLSNLVKTLNFNLKEERKLEKEKQNLIAKKEDTEKKQKTETDIEKKKGPSKISKLADKLLAPVKDLFEGIFNYIKLTALNFVVGAVYKWFTDPANKEKVEKIKNFFTSVGGWFQDPENQKKLSTIGRFLKDNWKIILGIGGVILLWNSGIGAIVGAIGFAVKGIGATLLLLAKNPLIAAAIGIGAGVAYLSSLPSEPNADVDESVEEVGKEKTLDILKEQQENRNIFQKMGDFITGAGSEREEQIYRLETGEEKRYNKGGMVPVMLTKGEWVVPPEQVQKIGVNKLTSINNIGNYNRGGNVYTNTDEFNLGGLVPGRGPNVDTVRTVLPEGSYVIQRPSVDILGAENIPGMIANLGGSPGLSGGGGETNALTNQAKVRSIRQMIFDPTGDKLRKRQFDDPQNYLTNEEFENRGEFPGKTSRRRENKRPYNSGGSIRNFLTSNSQSYNSGGSIRNFLTSNSQSYNSGGSIRNFLTSNQVSNQGRQINNSQSYNSGGSIRNFLTSNSESYNSGGSIRNFLTSNSESYNSGGSIRNFLALNRGGRVDNPKSQEGRGKARKTGRSGGTTKVEMTDGGSAIVAAAKNAVRTGRQGPARPPCASWVRMVLGMANHPAANQTTTTADLDPQIGPDSAWATSLNSAASFAGSDLGTVIRNSGSLKPGDIVLHKNTFGNYGPGAITHVSIASDKKGKILHQNTTGGAPLESNMFSFAHGLRLGGEGTIGEYSNDDPGSTPGKTEGQFIGGALGALMQRIGLDPRAAIGTPIKNAKITDVSNTSPSDIDSEEEKSSAAVNSLSPDSETIDKRSGSKDSDRVSSTLVRTGSSSINLYNWQYDKIYGIVGA